MYGCIFQCLVSGGVIRTACYQEAATPIGKKVINFFLTTGYLLILKTVQFTIKQEDIHWLECAVQLRLECAVQLRLECAVQLRLECAVRLRLECAVRLRLECAVRLRLECVVRLRLECAVRLLLECGTVLAAVLGLELAVPCLLFEMVVVSQ